MAPAMGASASARTKSRRFMKTSLGWETLKRSKTMSAGAPRRGDLMALRSNLSD
jgi:hypothetical protein